jgi:hypothetical protein
MNNNSMGSGFPSFMATGDPGANVDFLAADASALSAFDPFGTVAAHTVALAVPFDTTATFSAGGVIPGRLHRIPSGDRASVQSAGKYDTGMWTVEFTKPYAGGPFDFAVVPGSSVEFSHEIFDNEGGSSSGHGGFDPTVYTLDFGLITSVDEPLSQIVPKEYSLEQNYPNPFNPSTKIVVDIAKRENVRLVVYNIIGQEVATLMSGDYPAGRYEVTWLGHDRLGLAVAGGVYLYRLDAGSFSMIKKMLLIK